MFTAYFSIRVLCVVQGYAAAHELVMDETVDRGSEHGKLSEGVGGSTGGMPGVIVDHNPSMCRLCVAKKDGNPAASVGGGMGGLLFPLSPPLWARIGAADPSAGRGEEEEQPTPTDGDEASKKTPLFFPRSLSRNDGGDEGDHAKAPSKGEGGETSGGGVATGGGEGHSGSSGFFNTAGVFRGMNVNMASVATMFKSGGATETTSPGVGPAASSETGAGAGEQPTPPKREVDTTSTTNVAADLAAKWGVSFGRLASKGVSESPKEDPKAPSAAAGSSVGGGVRGSERGSWSSRRDSGFGSIFRKVRLLGGIVVEYHRKYYNISMLVLILDC